MNERPRVVAELPIDIVDRLSYAAKREQLGRPMYVALVVDEYLPHLGLRASTWIPPMEPFTLFGLRDVLIEFNQAQWRRVCACASQIPAKVPRLVASLLWYMGRKREDNRTVA